ncbi:hypothetical protein ACHAXA_006865 [Cyclostephanos tholiformis]|uniref:EF-hand domain-containing protein n=1 Tax=Cyclostephanos tholiformis TaxID=382380 RepID=A0ABD3REW6_9STRA
MLDGVGKSSLVSTFVSRHFSERVPGVLTRVKLPPEPSLSKCTTTIIDTQEGDAILSDAVSLSGMDRGSSVSVDTSLPGCDFSERSCGSSPTSSFDKQDSTLSPYRGVDAIILVYDLDRIESFHRLEDHWLLMIERCYNGELPVIVAGNKIDLAAESERHKSPSRQQIISLLRRFKFVRQCIKCSAKILLNVDEVFTKSQQAVLCPIWPLYDLNTGKLTVDCSRALTRIFRIFDTDRDGLLSDAELNAFQKKFWGVPLLEKDLSDWKVMVTQHDSSGDQKNVLREGKFTVAGFLIIFDILITGQNRLEVPWKVLRTLGYDDDLNLSLPASISPPKGCDVEFPHLNPNDWRLTRSDIDFLTKIFVQFDSDGNGTLSSRDLNSIFSVLSPPSPPWSERGSSLFRDCYSLPLVENEKTPPSSPSDPFDVAMSSSPTSQVSSPSSMISPSGVTISSSTMPSVDMSKDVMSLYFQELSGSKPLSYLSWMNLWHMICTISPTITRAEMYKLGYSFEHVPSRLSLKSPSIIETPPTLVVRAVVLGSKNSRKRGLVHKLHQWRSPRRDKMESEYPATSCSVSKIIRSSSRRETTRQGDETTVHLILTEVPAVDLSSDTERMNLRARMDAILGRGKSGKRPYDMAVLTFDATRMQSLEFAKELERYVLNDTMPRVFVGTTTEEIGMESNASNEALRHCKCMDLETPIFVPLDSETSLDSIFLEHLVNCALNQRQFDVLFRSTPYGNKKRVVAKRRKILWIGGLVTAGITVVLGFTFGGKKKTLSSTSENGGLIRLFQALLPISLFSGKNT